MWAGSSPGQSFGPIPADPPVKGPTPQGPAGVSRSVGEGPPASPHFPTTPWGSCPSSFLALSIRPSVSTGESREAQDDGGLARAMLEEMGPPPQPLLPGPPPWWSPRLPTPTPLNLPPDSIWLPLSVPKQRP